MDELRIGVVGCGAIGRDHIRRINRVVHGARVTAVADVFVEGGTKVANQWGARFFEDGEEMIRSDLVDAVVITTLDQFHEQYAVAAIKAGKYVFCEKPLAPDAASCKRIMEAEMQGGRHLLQVGFMRRYDAGYRALKEIVRERKYGEPLMLHCAHRAASIAPNYVTSMLISNCAVHEIDVLRWLLGEDYATAEVRYGKKCRRAGENLQDPQVMILTTKSGVRIDVEAFVTTGHCYQIKCEVVCEDAILNLPESPTINVCTGANVGHEIDSDWSTRFAEAYDTEFQEWINATKAGRVDGPTAWDGYAGQVAAAAASKARDTQTIVPVEYDPMPAFYQK